MTRARQLFPGARGRERRTIAFEIMYMDRVPTMKERQKMAQEVNHSARTVTEVMTILITNNLFDKEKGSILLYNVLKKTREIEERPAKTTVETATTDNNGNGNEDGKSEETPTQAASEGRTRGVEANVEGNEKSANFNDNEGGKIDPRIEEKFNFMQVQVDRIADHEQLPGGGHPSSLRPPPLRHTVLELGHRCIIPQVYEGGLHHRPP